MRWLLVVALALSSACIEGPEGPPGPRGPPGTQGTPGQDGADGTDGSDGAGLVSSVHCIGTVTANITVNVVHDIYRFADGSVMGSCWVWGANSGLSGTNLWKAGTNGASLGACIVYADVDTGTYGFWTMEQRSAAASTVVYNDSGSGQNARTFTITCAAR